jgi:Zinc-binding dehydrogenase
MPGGAGTGREVDASGSERRSAGRGGDGVDVDLAREPVGRALLSLDATARDLQFRLAPFVLLGGTAWSRRDHHLDRLAVGHRAVAVRDAVEADGPVQHLAGVDQALEDVGQQLLDVVADRRGTAADDRIALAKEFGATDVVSERGEEAVERMRELTGGFGAHSVLECVGLEQSELTAIEIARPGGAGPRRRPQAEKLPASQPAFYSNVTGGGPE